MLLQSERCFLAYTIEHVHTMILRGLTSVLLCVPFIFVDSSSVNLVVACGGFLCISCIFRSGYSDYRDVFHTVLLCDELKIASNEA